MRSSLRSLERSRATPRIPRSRRKSRPCSVHKDLAIEGLGDVVVVAHRLAVAPWSVPTPADGHLRLKWRGRAHRRRARDPPRRACCEETVAWRQRHAVVGAPQTDHRLEVFLHVELTRHPRTSQPQVVGLAQEVADDRRVTQDDDGGPARYGSRRRQLAVVPETQPERPPAKRSAGRGIEHAGDLRGYGAGLSVRRSRLRCGVQRSATWSSVVVARAYSTGARRQAAAVATGKRASPSSRSSSACKPALRAATR